VGLLWVFCVLLACTLYEVVSRGLHDYVDSAKNLNKHKWVSSWNLVSKSLVNYILEDISFHLPL
jgi:hypothetical protein